ncbi:hypothetical protein GCM10010505_42650 [Kitasatospora aburaviensis]
MRGRGGVTGSSRLIEGAPAQGFPGRGVRGRGRLPAEFVEFVEGGPEAAGRGAEAACSIGVLTLGAQLVAAFGCDHGAPAAAFLAAAGPVDVRADGRSLGVGSMGHG